MTPHEIQSQFRVHRNMIGGGWLRLKPGQVTDDTEMNLALGQALIEAKTMQPGTVADFFVRWMRSKPVDIGDTVSRGLRRYLNQGTVEAMPEEFSAGNGGLMRNLPVIIATLSEPHLMESWSLAQARITHHNPLSDAGILLISELTRLAILHGQEAPLQSTIHHYLQKYPIFDFSHYRGESDGYIVHTVKTVLHYFMHTLDFESCLLGIVNQGGDADTNGAVAGMLAGAFYGMDQFPSRWLKKLNPTVKDQIHSQVDQLFEIFEG